jgi:hypothetical protein
LVQVLLFRDQPSMGETCIEEPPARHLRSWSLSAHATHTRQSGRSDDLAHDCE